jgi:hypothetical protein
MEPHSRTCTTGGGSGLKTRSQVPYKMILVGTGGFGKAWCARFLPPNIKDGLVEVGSSKRDCKIIRGAPSGRLNGAVESRAAASGRVAG